MQYSSTDRSEVRKLAENSPATVIVPYEDYEATEEIEQRLTAYVDRSGNNPPVLMTGTSESTPEGDVATTRFLDVELLGKLLYEYRRYEAARGFSDSELDVLRAVEFDDARRVFVEDIIDSEYTEDLAESTVYNHLRNLQEKGLVEKLKPGAYRYTGP